MSRLVLTVAATAGAVALAVALKRKMLKKRVRIAFIRIDDRPARADHMITFSQGMGMPLSAFEEFLAFEGQFPSVEELPQYTGILITGGHFSVVDASLPWVPKLINMLQAAAELPELNVLGCCFGAQAVALALGGKVGNNPDGQFHCGPEQIDLLPHIHTLPWIPSELGAQSTLRLNAVHGEQVLELPPSAVPLGGSAATKFELFIAGKHHNFFCCQAHPEYNAEFMMTRVGAERVKKGKWSAEQLERMRTELQEGLDCDAGCHLYRAFLMRGL